MSNSPTFPHLSTASRHHHVSASASASSTPTTTSTSTSTSTSIPSTPRRSNRKSRHQVTVPADSLLNFSTYHPPPHSSSPPHSSLTHHHRYHTNYPKNNSSSSSSKSSSRPREQFVQANYRFFVTPSPDLKACQFFPNALVPWPFVDLVVLPRPSDSCPICLYPLRAPRVTPCGHVFDHVCMLQLFSHHPHPKCPLCAHHVSSQSLRPCAFATALPPVVNANITLRLVSRQRGSMLCHAHPHPVLKTIGNAGNGKGEERTEDIVPVVKKIDTPLFCRFAYALPKFLLQLIDCDKRDLTHVARDDVSLTPFVSVAMAEIDARSRDILIRSLPVHINEENDSDSDIDVHVHSNSRKNQKRSSNSSSQSNQGSETTASIIPGENRSNASSNTPNNITRTDKSASTASKTHWFFYQDKQSGNAFLHPVNHRVLSTEFNNDFNTLANQELSGKILQVDHYTMDDTLRKRYRVLEHLPDGCEFTFVELDLTHILSHETLKFHEVELRERRAARRKREIELEKETRRVEQAQTKQLREYYSSLGNGGIAIPQTAPMDATDVTSFPKLRDDDGDDDSKREDDAEERERENRTEDDGIEHGNETEIETENETETDSTVGVGGWGREISSYSSVTTNMGLFPVLGSSPQEAGSRTLRGAWGGMVASSPPSVNIQPDRFAESRGNVNGDSLSNSAGAAKKVESRRNGRRSNGKSKILLSNAGAQARR